MDMKGIILGAGIAGLSTAIAMHQRNISVKIFEIASSKTLRQAFLDFEQSRRTRVKRIVDLSRQIGKFSNISNPITCQMRNALMRWTPSYLANKQSQQLYTLPY